MLLQIKKILKKCTYSKEIILSVLQCDCLAIKLMVIIVLINHAYACRSPTAEYWLYNTVKKIIMSYFH